MMSGDALKAAAALLVEQELSARRCGEQSRRMVRTALREFLRWASRRGTGDLRLLTKKDFVSYHVWLSKRPSKRTGLPLTSGTVNQRFSTVALLFSCLYRSGLIPANPLHGLDLRLPKPSGWRRRPLTRDEVTRFLESIDTKTDRGLRDRTLYELIYSSGLRVSEAAALKVCDIDFPRRLMIVRGKLDRDRMVPISHVAADFIVHFLGPRIDRADDWVFPGCRGHLSSQHISNHFRELLREFKMDKADISTHSLRHSTATHLLENGASIRHVQELLGHSCIESTVRYTHVMIDSLAKVYRKHHPREHELFEAVDGEYERRFSAFLAGRGKRR